MSNQQTTESLKSFETFQWTKQWYPVAVVAFLASTKPHKIELLGKNLVVWCEKNDLWHCFEDFCPHRGAPFSEGRIEPDGTLMCSYHAWRFDGNGQCLKIPQCKDKQTEIKHSQNARAYAITYPTQIRQGLIWIWPEFGSQAHLESQAREPRVYEIEEKSQLITKAPWTIRDLPYGWDFFFENVSDPAHAPVSHHGFLGNRYTDAKYYDPILVREVSTQDGFAFKIRGDSNGVGEVIHDFQPPCLERIEANLHNGNKLVFILYAIPTRPGWCRHIARQVLIKNKNKRFSRGLSIFALNIPTWISHLISSLFLHQDLVFLHYQEKNLAKKGIDKWAENVYIPNPQDKIVIAFRQWFKHKAGASIPWDTECSHQLPTAEQNKQKLFDVWTTHTQHCKVCQDALKRIKFIRNTLYTLGAFSIITALLLDNKVIENKLSSGLSLNQSGEFWIAIGIALLFFLVGYLLNRIIPLFYVYEFSHADND